VSRAALRILVLVLALANVVAFLWLQRERAARQAAEAPLPPDVPRLRLLAEARRPEAAARACRAVAVAGRDRARALARSARAAGLEAELGRVEAREVTGYWVYLPPFPDREAAREAVRRLAEAGVRDVQVLGGRRANAVSLGLFRNRALAERRRQQAAALGYEPVVEPRARRAERWRVELRGEAGALDTFLRARRLEGAPCVPAGTGSG